MNKECDLACAIREAETAKRSLPPQGVEKISLRTETVLVVEDEEPICLQARIMASSIVIPYLPEKLFFPASLLTKRRHVLHAGQSGEPVPSEDRIVTSGRFSAGHIEDRNW